MGGGQPLPRPLPDQGLGARPGVSGVVADEAHGTVGAAVGDDDGVAHRGVFAQEGRDALGLDAVAVDLDLEVRAAEEVERAVVTEAAEVSGPVPGGVLGRPLRSPFPDDGLDPGVGQRGHEAVGGRGGVQVAARGVRGADPDLAVDQGGAGAGQRLPDRLDAGPGLRHVPPELGEGGLGGTVEVDHPSAAEPLAPAGDGRRGQGLAREEGQPQGVVGAGLRTGRGGPARGERGDGVDDGDPGRRQPAGHSARRGRRAGGRDAEGGARDQGGEHIAQDHVEGDPGELGEAVPGPMPKVSRCQRVKCAMPDQRPSTAFGVEVVPEVKKT
ncbi:hypothetical protein KMB26_29620 [Streptomyces sp. CYG20]|nr:hypothetical protein [Streptomyces sp. CYG20]MBT3113211.1 hypothetical protein [Streptomyces sp. CYG20]